MTVGMAHMFVPAMIFDEVSVRKSVGADRKASFSYYHQIYVTC